MKSFNVESFDISFQTQEQNRFDLEDHNHRENAIFLQRFGKADCIEFQYMLLEGLKTLPAIFWKSSISILSERII